MISKQDLENTYTTCGVSAGGVVYVTGNLGRIGLTRNGENAKLDTMKDHLDALLSILGPNGTLIFPTHTWANHSQKGVFDVQKTPTDYAFSEFLRTTLNPARTNHCMSSIAAYGAQAESIINAPQSRNPYGHQSPFGKMVELGAIHLSLGLPYRNSVSAVHHCELIASVPYRYMKEFAYTSIENGEKRDTSCSFYVTYLGADLVRDRNLKISSLADNQAATRKSSVGRGYVESIDLSVFVPTTVTAMIEDPYIWLKEPPTSRPWNT